ILVWSVAMGSQIAHKKEGYGDLKAAKKGSFFAIPGAIIGTMVGYLLIETISDITIKIMALSIVSWILYKAIVRMLTREDITGQAIGEMNERYWSTGVFFGGMSSGLLGIGGGGIFVTMNRNYGGFDTKSSAGTSFMLAAMVVPTAILSHIIIDGSAFEIYEQATVYAVIIPFLVASLSFSGAKYAINYLPVRFITSLFIMIISLSMIKYIQEIILIII
ncbi:MAG: TSUP family transporter, partial [Candidatus Poseidoniales archaeon]|nr:TSUP family transporter [Candidatus Poseidoniales archaeon]